MKKLLSIITICLIGCCYFAGCSSKDNSEVAKSQNDPKATVEEYFKCWNQKDRNKMKLLEIEALKNLDADFEFDNLKSIKLVSCEDCTSKNFIEEEIKRAVNDKIVSKESARENVKCFNVRFDIKLKNENQGARDSGISEEIITLVRKDKNSKWLISSMGEG
ncbi:hypothetical protein Z957_10255 [Clostridium sp. K25]|uniref:DUF4829 domain-containing protein n=1 Tax=Clostridium sp. K25 TaxID=1443109 RepID=UPI0004D7035C|nr:DUF4829 domain-containing protein [Clostridium sp. K25]KEI11050.1 hypothetical protein Z957_10255 [Clostridium sp. K25]